jgi:hypothetical protein
MDDELTGNNPMDDFEVTDNGKRVMLQRSKPTSKAASAPTSTCQ